MGGSIMANEITQLKAELNDMNVKCQLARDNEVRFALQRGRLEAERTQLLVKMIEAMAPATAAAVTPVASPAVMPFAYNITMASPMQQCSKLQEAPVAIPVTLRAPGRPRSGKKKRNPKPANLPPTEEMILAVLQGAGWLRPNQITQAIRSRYWPDAPRNSAPPVVWRMAQRGVLEKGEYGYRLPAQVVVGSLVEHQRKSNGQFGT
jgi:hypothetical protein